jgi:hypothetical protein
VTLRALKSSVGFCATCFGFSLSDPHDPRSNEQPARVQASNMIDTMWHRKREVPEKGEGTGEAIMEKYSSGLVLYW